MATKVPAFEKVEFSEADGRLDEALSSNFQGDYDSVLLFDGDLELDGDFLAALGKLTDEEYELVAINGNLTVHGDLAIWDSHPGLLVTGHTTADTLQGGDAEIYLGTGTFKYLVYGYYNHGILETGEVDTPWVINSDHDLRVSSEVAKRVDNYGEDDDADFSAKNIPEVFVPEVVDAEYGQLDVGKFLARLREGKPVLRPGARTAVEAALDKVEAAKRERVRELDLTKHKLKQFPAEILNMPWLEKLVLDDNDLGSVPDAIGSLGELRELSLASCGLGSLPPSIGQLRKLRVLRVGGNSVYDFEKEPAAQPIALPDTLGELASLEELDVSKLSAKPASEEELPETIPYALPASAGKLAKLRVLIAHHTNLVIPREMYGLPSLEVIEMEGSSWNYLRRVPAGVFSFPNLKRLDLSSNFCTELPDALLELANLEELDLGNALGFIKRLPDLSKLRKLRVLNISGNTDHTGVSVPNHKVLRQLFDMELPALEDLRIDRWGEEDDDRPAPKAKVFAGIGRFRALKRLDMSFNDLEALPDDFYTLPALEEVDLHYNKLPAAVRKRIAATFPKVRIDLRNQDVEDEDEVEAAVVASDLIKEANRLRSQERWDAALAKYDEALAQYTDGSASSAYGQLYALYSKMWIHGKVGYAQDDSEAVRAKHRSAGVALAHECLKLVPPVWQIWHFTDEGQFHREVVRYATNFIAWESVAAKASNDALTTALELIERGVACADREHTYVHDTHARVLLALGRDADAWRIVQRVLQLDPSFAAIQDLAKDPRYSAWLKS